MPNATNLKDKGFNKHPERINRSGRPKKIPSLEILLAKVFTEREMTAILKALQRSALKGNVRAIEILLERKYGKVKQHTELSGSIGASPITGIQIIIDDCKAESSEKASSGVSILD
jgi:hypothetical protein